MKITLDHEDCAQLPWTLVAENATGVLAAVCDQCLSTAQTRMDLLLIELGYELYCPQTEQDGFIIY